MESRRPPVSRITGMVPYRRATIWARPQGSLLLGISRISPPAYILRASSGTKPCQKATEPGLASACSRKKFS